MDKESKFTCIIGYVEQLPSKCSYSKFEECANASISFGQAKFGNNLMKVKILKDGVIVSSWRE